MFVVSLVFSQGTSHAYICIVVITLSTKFLQTDDVFFIHEGNIAFPTSEPASESLGLKWIILLY